MPNIPETIQYLDFRYNNLSNKIDKYVRYPNLIFANGSKISEELSLLSIPPTEPPKVPGKMYGECSVDGKVCEVTEYITESEDNIIMYHEGKFNCCKRSKIAKTAKQTMVGRVNYYFLKCINKWVPKNDYIKIKNTHFSFYRFREIEGSVNSEPNYTIIPYSIEDYKRF
jgi:hypothetical protein